VDTPYSPMMTGTVPSALVIACAACALAAMLWAMTFGSAE
jgi:hypothetical protein